MNFGLWWLRYLSWNCPQMNVSGPLTHWVRVTHICVGTLTIIGSDNGLSPCRRQAIIWTNAGLLLIGPLGKNFNEILIQILSFSFKKMRLKVLSAKWRPFCLGLNVLSDVKSTVVQSMAPCAYADPVLCRHMASLGHNELNQFNWKAMQAQKHEIQS